MIERKKKGGPVTRIKSIYFKMLSLTVDNNFSGRFTRYLRTLFQCGVAKKKKKLPLKFSIHLDYPPSDDEICYAAKGERVSSWEKLLTLVICYSVQIFPSPCMLITN